MTRLLMSLVLTTTALAPLTAAAAGPHGNSRGESRGEHFGSHTDYHTRFGTKFSHGYFYKGREHSHWTHRYHWAQYGCDCYWCPSTSCWYYFSESRDCYLPVSCIREAPPAPVNVAAAAAASSSAVVAPTVVTNIIGLPPQQAAPVALPSDLPPPAPPSAPSKVTNTSIGSVGTMQPIGLPAPLPPGR
jgi:hypothetical protein